MANEESVVWHPLSMLPMLANMLDQQLEHAVEQLGTLQACQSRPHVLDDATIDRVLRLFTDQIEFLEIYREQVKRWLQEAKTADHRGSVERFSAMIEQVDAALVEVLTLAKELSTGTIDKILGMGDMELATAALKGDMPFPPSSKSTHGLAVKERHKIAEVLDLRMQDLMEMSLDEFDILGAMHDYMAGFKHLMDTAAPDELNKLMRRFPGLMQFVRLLESVAAKIQSGEIKVPP